MDNPANRIAAIAGMVVAALIIGLGVGLAWQVWVWLPCAAVLGTVVAIVLRSLLAYRDTDAAPRFQPPVTPPPQRPVPQQETIPVLELPSGDADYRFQFSATVWRVRDLHAPVMSNDFAAEAKRAIIVQAVELTQTYRPEDHAVAAVYLNADLSGRKQIAGGHYVWASDVTLTLSDTDKKRLERTAELRRQQVLWEHERQRELSVREYLGGDVLRDPGTAVVWWFARNLDKPDGLTTVVRDIDNMHRLTAAAHATRVSPPEFAPNPMTVGDGGQNPLFDASPRLATGEVEHPSREADSQRRVVDAVDQLVSNAEPAVAHTLYRRLGTLFETHGYATIADTFGHRCDMESAPDPTVGIGPDGGADAASRGEGRASTAAGSNGRSGEGSDH